MSSAETTHAVEWRDDGAEGWEATLDNDFIAEVRKSSLPGWWVAVIYNCDGLREVFSLLPTASAARSFVEKSVKEAGQ